MDLGQILLDQQILYKELVLKKPSVVREVKNEYERCLKSKHIKIITGVRRCGKSFFSLASLPLNETIYINFDDERLFDLSTKDLNTVYKEALKILPNAQYWIMDEIQNVEGWELFVSRLRQKGLNLIVTGSNSKLLSKELASHLTGRTLSLYLMPFSFKEYLEYQDVKVAGSFSSEQEALVRNHFDYYLKNGGFPETFTDQMRMEYLRELFDRIITRDIIQRYQIRDSKTLKSLAILLMNYSAQELNYVKLQKNFSTISINTLKKYTSYIQETYLNFEVESYSQKVRERLTKSRKIYSIDTGMFNALNDNSQRTLGRQLENLVFLELVRRKYDITYLKTQNFEIDFIIQKNRKVQQLLQVCWNLDNEDTKEREIKGIKKGMENLRCREGLILTYNTQGVIDGIKTLPVWKWLLS